MDLLFAELLLHGGEVCGISKGRWQSQGAPPPPACPAPWVLGKEVSPIHLALTPSTGIWGKGQLLRGSQHTSHLPQGHQSAAGQCSSLRFWFSDSGGVQGDDWTGSHSEHLALGTALVSLSTLLRVCQPFPSMLPFLGLAPPVAIFLCLCSSSSKDLHTCKCPPKPPHYPGGTVNYPSPPNLSQWERTSPLLAARFEGKEARGLTHCSAGRYSWNKWMWMKEGRASCLFVLIGIRLSQSFCREIHQLIRSNGTLEAF